MVSKDTLIALLPIRDQVVLIRDTQNTDDIRSELLSAHRDFAGDYDLISSYFDRGNLVETCQEIFDFLKTNVPYGKENGRYQTIKSPALILSCNDGTGNFDKVDCKNYASFSGGVLDSLKRNKYPDLDWCYRFASYDANDPEPGHVFVVVAIDGKELWIDPVFAYFNGGDMHEWEVDEVPGIGGLYRISGPNDGPTGKIVVNAAVAWKNFLFYIQYNLFGVRDLILAYPKVLPQLQAFCKINGFDFDQLLRFIHYGNQ